MDRRHSWTVKDVKSLVRFFVNEEKHTVLSGGEDSHPSLEVEVLAALVTVAAWMGPWRRPSLPELLLPELRRLIVWIDVLRGWLALAVPTLAALLAYPNFRN